MKYLKLINHLHLHLLLQNQEENHRHHLHPQLLNNLMCKERMAKYLLF
jgi:hypothetical protein